MIRLIEWLETLKLYKDPEDTLRFGWVSIRWCIADIQPHFMFGVSMVKFINVLQEIKFEDQVIQFWLMFQTPNQY